MKKIMFLFCLIFSFSFLSQSWGIEKNAVSNSPPAIIGITTMNPAYNTTMSQLPSNVYNGILTSTQVLSPANNLEFTAMVKNYGTIPTATNEEGLLSEKYFSFVSMMTFFNQKTIPTMEGLDKKEKVTAFSAKKSKEKII